ncbi:MAG: hypothetical protein J6L59_02905 [Clostridia bacterium]|nr:hypothetical protein [Clostridia bacterium]
MAYRAGFSDNQLIGVDDLNEITKRLVTSGVGYELGENGSIEVTELNGYTAALATSGVVPSGVKTLKVSRVVNSVYIEPGTAFFADGSFIEITSQHKLSFSYSNGYVYLLNDTALGTKRPRVTQELPSGDYVLLAQIVNGSVIDKRQYTKGKVPSYASCAGYPIFVSQTVNCAGETKYERKGSFTVDIGDYPLHGIAVCGDDNGKPSCTGLCLFDENKKVKLYRSVANYDTSVTYKQYLLQYLYHSQWYAYMEFSCTESGLLTVNVTSSASLNSEGPTSVEQIEFVIF